MARVEGSRAGHPTDKRQDKWIGKMYRDEDDYDDYDDHEAFISSNNARYMAQNSTVAPTPDRSSS